LKVKRQEVDMNLGVLVRQLSDVGGGIRRVPSIGNKSRYWNITQSSAQKSQAG